MAADSDDAAADGLAPLNSRLIAFAIDALLTTGLTVSALALTARFVRRARQGYSALEAPRDVASGV